MNSDSLKAGVFEGVPAAELIEYAFSLIDSGADVDSAVEAIMVRMGAYFNVDLIVVKERQEKGASLKCTYEWSRSRHILIKGLERRFVESAILEWKKRYDEGGGHYIYKKSMGECPIVLAQNDDIVSLIQIPVYRDDSIICIIDFVDSYKERDWTEEEILQMKSICNVVCNYMFSLRMYTQMSDHLKEMLKRDNLTHLPKLDEFKSHVNESIAGDKKMGYVIISSDIANFKYINEKYGYNTGDLLLKKFAATVYLQYQRIVSCCREYSDIFLIALKCYRNDDIEDIHAMVDRCNMAFLDEVRPIIGDTNIAVNSGFTFVGDNELTVDEAITGATAARKAAKDMTLLSGSRSRAYEKGMIANKAKAVELIASCDSAIANNEFKVYFQPKVLCRTYEIVGAEALIRWEKPDGSCVLPDEFIPAFESSGCIVKTDFYVYEKVFEYLRSRLDRGLPCVPVSMNVSRVHLFNTSFVEKLDRLIEQYQIPTNLLEFELTESICLEKLPTVMFTLQWLRKMNIRISIDDFGSGYSSLDILTKLPINVLKLDKVFMKDQLTERDKIIISSIVEMAKKLGLDVICEGVEEDEQRVFLIEACCEKLQGYLFSKPVSVDEFDEMLIAGRTKKKS